MRTKNGVAFSRMMWLSHGNSGIVRLGCRACFVSLDEKHGGCLIWPGICGRKWK